MRFPPIPAFTTDTRLPYAACRRRDNTSGHRSSPFNVDSVPSVIESPNAHTTTVFAGAITSTASRKYHDVVVNGNAASSSSPVCTPDRGRLRYEVCNAFACHVIGPLAPATRNDTANLRPSVSAPAGSFSSIPSLYMDAPAAIVMLRCPPKRTGRFVPLTMLPANDDTPTYTASNVTGCVPKVLARRMRTRSPHRSGRTINLND